MERTITITVVGRPQQRGSKRAFAFHRSNGKLGVSMADANAKSKDWMSAIACQASQVYDGPLLRGPIKLGCVFYFARPQSHFGSGKNHGIVKPSAPAIHAQSPDIAKLMRAVEDALTGVLWQDDRQVYGYAEPTERRWIDGPGAERVEITVTVME